MSLYKLAAYSLEKESSFKGAAVHYIKDFGHHVSVLKSNLTPEEDLLVEKAQSDPHYREILHKALKDDGVKLPKDYDPHKSHVTPVNFKALITRHAVNQHGVAGHSIIAKPTPQQAKQIDDYYNKLTKYRHKTSLDTGTIDHLKHIRRVGEFSNYHGTEYLQKQPPIQRGPNEIKRNDRWIG